MLKKLKTFHSNNQVTITILLAVAVAWLLWGRFIANAHSTNPEKSGTLGDSYGVITSFFSALAFAGVAISIYLQRKELKETKAELNRQRFETTFFNMLQIHLEVTQGLQSIHGERIGVNLLKQYLDGFRVYIGSFQLAYRPEYEERYRRAYDDSIGQFYPLYSGYVQSITSLQYLVVHSTLKVNDRNRFLAILNSYISITEKVFLFYTAVWAKENDTINHLRMIHGDIEYEVPEKYLFHPSHSDFTDMLPAQNTTR
jgi:hypothetical protein